MFKGLNLSQRTHPSLGLGRCLSIQGPSINCIGRISKGAQIGRIRASESEEDGEDFDDDYLEEGFIDVDDGWDDPSMRLYLDSADTTEWGKWVETGIFYGFTTNPTILKRDEVPCTVHAMRSLTRHAFELGANELQLQAWGATMQEIYSCALDLTELDPRVIVKIPLTVEGLKAAKRLSDDDVPFTVTGVYSVHQVVTALAAGASYIAPYLGRMNDAGKNGLELISQMQSILEMTTLEDGDCRLLVASLRSADDIAALAAEGCNTFTISPKVAEELVSDPLTLQAVEIFEQHASEMGAKDK